jgi:pilus assembly protein FimV
LRTLKLVCFSVIFFLSSNLAHSLGVGDITVNSALNQPLNAEIQLVALRPGEIDNIRVSMASPAEFARAGIDRPLVLAGLKFRVEERPGNKAAIIVYSKKAIKEPFLDFLVEIDWRSGRMLREYTMLLDPPVLAQRKAERVQVPVAPAPAVVPAPAPVINQPEPKVTATPVERPAPVAVSPSAAEDELFPRVDIGAVGQPVGKKEAPFRPALDVSSEGYKTKTNDTLWSISDRLRPEGISIEQMMLALQNANPQAFEANNINGLKAGYVLRIPDQDALLAFSKSEAFREAQNQHKAWSSARGGLIERATTKGTAPVSEAPTTAAPSAPSEAGIKLVTPEAGVASKGAGTGKDLEALRQELALVNEQLASKEQQNTELEGRLRELEEQIASMERLIELKNKSLEDLQTQVTEPAPAPAAPLAPEPVQPETPEPVAVDKPVQPAEVVDGEEVINRYALKDIPEAEAPPAPVAKPAAKKPAPVTAPAGEESIVDTILGLLDDVT